jgi:hypothetical protein
MSQKLEATDEYSEMSRTFDSITLLKTIKDISALATIAVQEHG